jgi:hypothetical protein
MSASRPNPEHLTRDQSETPFGKILAALVVRVPCARAAALVDAGGETVDYAGQGDPHAVRVAAAHWRIVLRDADDQPAMGHTVSLTVRAGRASFLVHVLPEGYAIVLLLAAQARPLVGTRALVACAGLLGKEAGWAGRKAPLWSPVDVISDPSGRPGGLVLAGATESVDVVGRCASSLGWREKAWRIRLAIGIEAMLVREPGGFWYADEPVEDLVVRAKRERERQHVAAPSHAVQKNALTGRRL